MNDAVLFMALMVGIVAGLGWLSLVTTVVADLVRDWRCDAVRAETEERVRREMSEWAMDACEGCVHRLWTASVLRGEGVTACRQPEPLSTADAPAVVADAERLLRERRGTG